MAFRIAVKFKHQKAFTLLELLVASAIGILAIIAVGSVFISGQRLTNDRSLRLLVLQNMDDALSYIKNDAQRAGYNGINGKSLILTGNSVISVTSSGKKTTLSYAYRNADDTITYTKFTGDLATKRLTVCTQGSLSKNTTTAPPVCNGSSLMDQNRVILTDFKINNKTLGNNNNTAYITITMKAKLKSGNRRYEQTMVTKIKQRNWK